jgi:pimeloyl-ACP methyl ester carboxylesterase
VSPFFCRLYDRALGGLIARFVKRPKGGFEEPDWCPESPDGLQPVEPLKITLKDERKGIWRFEAPSPFQRCPWPESRMLQGRAMGPEGAKAAVIVLHGACDNENTYSQWMGSAFEKAGYRVLVPAAPCHLDRRPPRTFSGAPMFWSTRLTVIGMAQWLTDIRGLMGYLRQQGVQTIGLIGYSIGSLTAGLAATMWDDLDFVCLLAPVGHHLAALPVSRVARTIWPWMQNLPPAELACWDRWAAINRQPLSARPLFLMTLFDDLQPIDLQRRWWQAWNRPEHHAYRHGHMSILFCRQLYRDLEAFARDVQAVKGNPK